MVWNPNSRGVKLSLRWLLLLHFATKGKSSVGYVLGTPVSISNNVIWSFHTNRRAELRKLLVRLILPNITAFNLRSVNSTIYTIEI